MAIEEQLPMVGGRTPVPDPTLLTTQQLIREIGALREILEARISAEAKSIGVRFDAMDKATELMRINQVHAVTLDQLKNSILVCREFLEEKIRGVADHSDTMFVELEKRTNQLAIANQKAIDAALQAQKEAAGESTKSAGAAINKSETAVSEAIKQLQTLFQTANAATNAKIDDVKSRLDKGEGKESGGTEKVQEQRGQSRDGTVMFMAIFAGLSCAAALITIVLHVLK